MTYIRKVFSPLHGVCVNFCTYPFFYLLYDTSLSLRLSSRSYHKPLEIVKLNDHDRKKKKQSFGYHSLSRRINH